VREAAVSNVALAWRYCVVPHVRAVVVCILCGIWLREMQSVDTLSIVGARLYELGLHLKWTFLCEAVMV